MSNNCSDLVSRRNAAVSLGVGRLNGTALSHGQGALVTDLDGKEYIDLAAGIGVMSVGHSHPAVVEAISQQCQKLQHACIHVSTYEPYVALCEKLIELFPHGDTSKAMLVNSGAEAVENAIKIARQATGRPAIICFSEGFHGRTLLATTLTSKVGYKLGCGPYAPETYRLQFPNYFRYGDGLSEDAFIDREIQRLRDAFASTVAADQVAAVIIEPIQGEGGFNPAPTRYLKALRQECDRHGVLLILDEVQSGFCRTGRWAAYQHSDVLPDISTWAKAMGGGLPISAVIGKAEIMDKARPGTLGGTYGGNPVACAAALASIDVMEKEDLCGRALAIGQAVRQKFEPLQTACRGVVDVRGVGAMMALELRSGTANVVARCLERGVLVITAGHDGLVLRLLPPLVITDQQLQRGLDVIAEEVEREFASVAVSA
jgi:4-aminobutyrate aminotransferase/(S)-3-amino-2-methylpropionate transaminase